MFSGFSLCKAYIIMLPVPVLVLVVMIHNHSPQALFVVQSTGMRIMYNVLLSSGFLVPKLTLFAIRNCISVLVTR